MADSCATAHTHPSPPTTLPDQRSRRTVRRRCPLGPGTGHYRDVGRSLGCAADATDRSPPVPLAEELLALTRERIDAS